MFFFNLEKSILPSFSLMFAWGRVGRPRGGTYEMCAGWGGAGWGE